MTLEEVIFGIAAAVGITAWILFVIFGQVTVRKLRKNPEMKDELGVEFLSGWDIFNVAQALSMPRSLVQKFKKSPLSFLHANYDLLYKHTNGFDRFLARLFFWPFYLSGFTLIMLVILDSLGIFG